VCPADEFVWKVAVPNGTTVCENGKVVESGQVWMVMEGRGVVMFGHTGTMVSAEVGDVLCLCTNDLVSLLTTPDGYLVLLCHRFG